MATKESNKIALVFVLLLALSSNVLAQQSDDVFGRTYADQPKISSASCANCVDVELRKVWKPGSFLPSLSEKIDSNAGVRRAPRFYPTLLETDFPGGSPRLCGVLEINGLPVRFCTCG
jgi:hypothetical protein